MKTKTLLGDDGAPLVLFHGTAKPFVAFSGEKVGSMHADVIEESGDFPDTDPTAFYFTTHRKTALWYAKDSAKLQGRRPSDGVIAVVELSMDNPKIVDFGGAGREYLAEEIDLAKRGSHDGLICRDYADGGIADHYIVFDPSKIKIQRWIACRDFAHPKKAVAELN